MKKTLLITLVLATSLLANYAYTGENSGKIDMHGGKTDNLLSNKNKFSNMGMNSLGSIGIKKPIMPTKPSELIKKEEKKSTTKQTEEKTDLNTIK